LAPFVSLPKISVTLSSFPFDVFGKEILNIEVRFPLPSILIKQAS
jgi:hypothetical protein